MSSEFKDGASSTDSTTADFNSVPSSSSSSAPHLVDITDMLKQTAKSLTFQKPMLHRGSGFSLQDSMAALELMDQKMDGCEVPLPLVFDWIQAVDGSFKDGSDNSSSSSSSSSSQPDRNYGEDGEQSRKRIFAIDNVDEGCRTVFPRPAPSGLNDNIEPLPWDDLTLEDSAFIAFQKLVLLEALLGGLSIVESTYVSLYAHPPVMRDMKQRLHEPNSLAALSDKMDTMTTAGTSISAYESSTLSHNKPSNLPQHIVYASTLMMVEFTDLFRNAVLNADIFEEEDFTVNTYGFPVMNDTDEASSLKMTSDVEKMLQSFIKSGVLEDSGDESFARMSLLIIEVLLDLYSIVSTLARLTGTNVQKEAHDKQKLTREVVKKIEEISALYKRMRMCQSDKSKDVIRQTFNTYVNRPLVGNAPVRKVLVTDPIKSVSNLSKIIHEIDWVVCNALLKGGTMGRIRRMLGQVSASSVNILSRSLLILNLYFDDRIFGQYSLPEMIARYMQQLAFTPDSVFVHPASQAFLNRLCKPIYDTLKLQTLNRNRQRSYLDVMLSDWASLRQEAYIVDMTCHEDNEGHTEVHPYFTLFVLFMTISLMDQYVELGVELQLFCTQHDLMAAFWYRDFLLSALLNQINTLRQMKQQMKQALALEEQQEDQSSPRQIKGTKKKGKNKRSSGGPNGGNSKNHELTITHTAEDLEDDYDLYVWNMKRVLCRGLVRFLAALKQGGLIEEKTYEFTSERKTFEKRFDVFNVIQQPPSLSYDDFIKGTDFEGIPSQDLLASTEECFAAGKSFVDRITQLVPSIDPDFMTMKPEELVRIVKVCFGNTIYLKKLTKILFEQKDGAKRTASVSIDNKTHLQYCTLVVKS